MPHNVHAPEIVCSHAALQPSGEGLFHRLCPACGEGVLLVYRDPRSLALVNVDRCTRCGQKVVYTDRFIGGEIVANIRSPAS